MVRSGLCRACFEVYEWEARRINEAVSDHKRSFCFIIRISIGALASGMKNIKIS
jgi:hypothetical protein